MLSANKVQAFYYIYSSCTLFVLGPVIAMVNNAEYELYYLEVLSNIHTLHVSIYVHRSVSL